MVGTPVSGSPALAKRIRFIHPVEKKPRASYYRVPENLLEDRRRPDLRMKYEGLRGLAPGDLPGTSAATVRSCVQELFQAAGQTHRIFFAHADHLTSLSNGHPAMAGKAHVPSIIREEIERQLLRAFDGNFPTMPTRKRPYGVNFADRIKRRENQALNSRKMPRQCHEEWLGRWRAHRACSKTRPVREEVRASLSSR